MGSFEDDERPVEREAPDVAFVVEVAGLDDFAGADEPVEGREGRGDVAGGNGGCGIVGGHSIDVEKTSDRLFVLGAIFQRRTSNLKP